MLRGYGTQFTVNPVAEAATTARRVMEVAADWVRRDATRWEVKVPPGLAVQAATGDVSAKVEFRSVPGASWGTLEYRHPDPRDPQRITLTRLRVAQAGNTTEAQVEVLSGHRSRVVAPVVASAAQPPFVIDIVRAFECHVGSAPVDERATELRGSDIKVWVEHVLLSPHRALPAILVTPDVGGTFPVNPDELAERTVAIGSVYVMPDPNDTFALTGAVGKMLSCFHGAVRVYYPRLTLADDPLRHPLYLGAKLRAQADPVGRVVGDLYALGSATIQDNETFLEAQRLVREHLTKTITATHDAAKLQALIQEKDADLAARDEAIAALRQELEDTKRAFGRYARNLQGDLKPKEQAAAEVRVPRNVGELVEQIAPLLENVSILPSAHRASADYGRKFHDQVDAALRCLNDLGAARDMGGGKLGTGVAEWVTKWQATHPKHPLPEFKAKESETTWNTASLRKQRTFLCDGAPVAMQMHFTAGAGDWGDCVQIFFEYGDVVGRTGILVGYIGPHLEISSARS